MSPNDADGMANSVDPDQTAPQSDQGLHCLPRPIFRKLRIITVKMADAKMDPAVKSCSVFQSEPSKLYFI